ncbi:hypothetical protein [Candidatus Rariloculus sp.]|uniref:hypothetical protein n=1 Tax=Candidatus Rariloculus sp. TaxID=3101265 RepID=UPI003D0C5BEC
MTQMNLNMQWARSHVEAMADGSLRNGDKARMREAMERDPALRAAVERARVLRGELRRLQSAPVPRRLRRSLLGIPARRPRVWQWLAGSVVAVAAAGALAVLVIRPAPPPVDPSVVAMQEFVVAMSYLHKTAVYANQEIREAVGDGLREAIVVSRNSVLDEESQNGNGG